MHRSDLTGTGSDAPRGGEFTPASSADDTYPRDLPPGPVVKICGFTRSDDIIVAARAGVWAVGLVFAPSPRRVKPSEARDLLQRVGTRRGVEGDGVRPRGGPLTVGVFVDASAAGIADVVRYVGLDAVQLHGAGGPSPDEVRAALSDWEAPLLLAGGEETDELLEGRRQPLVIQNVPVSVEGEDCADLALRLARADADADVLMVDASVKGRCGGTGQVVPWQMVAEAAAGRRFLLAGGIGPLNVREALATSGAWGVDVSSGVERDPGIKLADAMATLIATMNQIRGASLRGGGVTEQEGLTS